MTLDGIETTYTPPRWIEFALAARPVLAFIGLMFAALVVCIVSIVLAVIPNASLNTVVTASVLMLAALLCAGVPGVVVSVMAIYFAKRNADTIHMMATGGQLASVTARATVDHRPDSAPVILPPPAPARLEPVTPARMEITREDRLRETAQSARRILMSLRLHPTQSALREWCGVAGGEAAAELQRWMATAGWCESSGSGSGHRWIDGDKLVIPTASLPAWHATLAREKSYPVGG
jgi:hypothetical protein